MKFKVLTSNFTHNGKRKVFIQDMDTKGNLVLDTGFEMYFKDKEKAEKVCEILNNEFGNQNK